jgi:hypothetical protein
MFLRSELSFCRLVVTQASSFPLLSPIVFFVFGLTLFTFAVFDFGFRKAWLVSLAAGIAIIAGRHRPVLETAIAQLSPLGLVSNGRLVEGSPGESACADNIQGINVADMQDYRNTGVKFKSSSNCDS